MAVVVGMVVTECADADKGIVFVISLVLDVVVVSVVDRVVLARRSTVAGSVVVVGK